MTGGNGGVDLEHARLPVRAGLLLVGVLLIGANLRTAITSVGPLLGDIRVDLGIGGAVASILISLPLIAFALVSPLAPVIARRMGVERALGASLAVLAAAIVLRSIPLPGLIWVGTAALGVAIAVMNVLLPALIKQDYPHQIGMMTGLYSVAQSALAALAAGLAVPIAGATSGWRIALGVWAGLALVGLAVFVPQIRARDRVRPPAHDDVAKAAACIPSGSSAALWRSALAWQVAVFMGLQSVLYYVVITWWPAIEHSEGVSVDVAGWHQFAFQAVGIAGNMVTAVLVQRMRDQRAIIAGLAILGAAAAAGQLLLPAIPLLWVILAGASAGGSIVVALSLFGLRTGNHVQAAALSGMAQSVGYLLAAFGPVAIGWLHDVTGAWRLGLIVLLAATLAQLVVGVLAGRDRQLPVPVTARAAGSG